MTHLFNPEIASLRGDDFNQQQLLSYLRPIHAKNRKLGFGVCEYAPGVSLASLAFEGSVYSPMQNRIYLMTSLTSVGWYYVDCGTGNVVNYAGSFGSGLQYNHGAYSPTQNRIYLVPNTISGTNWHYIDCATGTLVSYSAGITLTSDAYRDGCYSPTQNRIYLVAFGEAGNGWTNWHYIDCSNGNAVAYANGVYADTVSGAYSGSVYSPTQNRIYLTPVNQANQTHWHYIDCSNGNIVAYSPGITAVQGAYSGGVWSPTQNRIYLVPNNQATQANWHYIDCVNGNVVPYAHGVTAVAAAYCGGVYSPVSNRIYFVPCKQANQTNWHYVDCSTGNIVPYACNTTTGYVGTYGAYRGGSYSPTQNRVYFVPVEQSNQSKWHYIQEYSTADIDPAVAAAAWFNKF
jgi:hypothetical protein